MKKQFTILSVFVSVLIFGLTVPSVDAGASFAGSPLVSVASVGHTVAYPRIYGSDVVYADNDGTGSGLSLVNVMSGEQKVIVNPATGGIFVGSYDISGTKVVYRLGNSIYLYDITTGASVQISTQQTNTVSDSPSIDGNYVTWYSFNTGGGGNTVVLYDINNAKEIQVTTPGPVGMTGGFVRPVVSGNKIVYEANMNGKPADLYLYDIPSTNSSKIGTGLMPRIYRDYVIWSGFGSADSITLYQISTQTQKVIGVGQAGQIYGDTVVYWSSADRRVHIYAISSGKTVTGFGDGGGFTGPDIYEKTLVWADGRDSLLNLGRQTTDIYSTALTEDNNPVPPTCTTWTYSDWSSCSPSGGQTRDIISSSPNSCEGGNPNLSQSCIYVPPIQSCTSSDWSCANWNTCSANGTQTRTCNKTSNCQGGVSSPVTSQSCTPPVQPLLPSCTSDTWSCGDWGSCSISGIQSRSCRKTFDCSDAQTPSPATDQYCEASSRPTQQVPQDSSQISNQDTILKATVKLICPLDEKTASQGSGTVIDSSGTILTNKHVVNGTLGCLVGFIGDFNDEPYFGDRQIADISKMSPSEDVAILKLRNPNNKTLSYIDITKGNSNTRLGTKVNIYGYPAKFGTNITYTSGDFSGTSGSYLKTTAIIEYGNSGGGAYLNDGTFIGVPSAVIKGELNALGYILSINTINGWLGNSSIAYNNKSNNEFSRVSSVLENIDLKKLELLKLIILDEKGTSSNTPAVVKPKAPTTIKPVPQQPNEIQKKETPKTEITSASPKQEVAGDKNSVAPTNAQPPKPAMLKRFFNWIGSWF